MKLDNGRSCLAVALAVFTAKAQAQLTVKYQDEFSHGVVQVGIGSPATMYSLLLDTGSANTWVGANKKYVPTSTSMDTMQSVAVKQFSGSFNGTEYEDRLELNGITFMQSIGVASTAEGYGDVDGVLGLGPTGLTVGTLSPNSTTKIPTVPDNLGSTAVTIANRHVIFGPPLVSISNIIYASITRTRPASNYWGIDASFSYAGNTLVSTTAGIVDYSATVISLPSDGYEAFLQATGAVEDPDTRLPVLPSCASLNPITLKFGGGSLNIPVSQYRVPVDQNKVIGGKPNICYLGVNNIGKPAGQGLDFILGFNTLKHFAVVLDKASSRVGIGNGDIGVPRALPRHK